MTHHKMILTERMRYERLEWMIFGPSALMAYDDLLLSKKGLELLQQDAAGMHKMRLTETAEIAELNLVSDEFQPRQSYLWLYSL